MQVDNSQINILEKEKPSNVDNSQINILEKEKPSNVDNSQINILEKEKPSNVDNSQINILEKEKPSNDDANIIENKNICNFDTIDYLDNNIKIIQNTNLYKFTSDAILLSKFAKAKTDDNVADFCSGSGVVGLNFYSINKKIKSVTLFEMQKELYDMSLRTIKLNALTNFNAENCKLQDINNRYNEFFSLILCNPPYEKCNSGLNIKNENISVCRHEVLLKLPDIILAAKKCLKFGGRFCMVHRCDRLSEIIFLMKQNNIEPKRLQFVCSKEGEKPYLLLIEGVKGGKIGVEILNNALNK